MVWRVNIGSTVAVWPLFAAIRSGDLSGFRDQSEVRALHDQVTRIFEDARDDVFRYLITLGLYPPEAQEATQDVFLRLYIALKNGEQIRNSRAWAFRVAHNVGLQIKAKQKSVPFDPGVQEKLRDHRRTPELDLLQRERMLKLNQAVESLSPQQQQCLRLRAQGLRYHEIAGTVGISISTVSEFLTRAIQRLRKATQ